MSAPSQQSHGRAPTGPNGAPAPPKIMRRPKPANPLVVPKRKPARPAAAVPAGTATKTLPARPSASASVPQPSSQPPRSQPVPVREEFAVNGFSGPLLSQKYVDYPVVTTKRALREGLKNHIARFAAKRSVDPRDESEFTRPVRLHRRDPRSRTQEPQTEKILGPDGEELDEVDREVLDARRAARDKERAENKAMIAPVVNSKRPNPSRKGPKLQQVYKSDLTPEEIAKARLKYEEALPWHLEDFDNRNTWVGNYEAALSETHAVFVLENTGKMRMIPAEKWYKFSAKSNFKALTLEEAEKYMTKKVKDPRWFLEKQEEMQQQRELAQYAKERKVFAGKKGGPSGTEGLEASEMDFEEDRFADDEEHDDLFNDKDEDTKVAEKRIREDQLKANIFGLKDEKDYEVEEMREKKEREDRHVLGKKVRRALKKRERNFDYSSGSDANPYTDDESSDDSEVERQKEEEAKKAEEEKNQKESASSSKGNNTPSGRVKHTDALKKSTGARKRLGSPNGSDASGTDTSRKKAKNKHLPSTSQPISRPISPSMQQAGKKRIRNIPLGSGSGSDVDAGAGSGGDLSESGKPKKIKLNPPTGTPRGGTPQGSRATSPAAGGRSFSGSRANSPGVPGRVSTPVSSGNLTFPTHAEIHAAIPPTGITSQDLLRIFRPRLGGSKENHNRFISIVKEIGVYNKEDKTLRPGSWKET